MVPQTLSKTFLLLSLLLASLFLTGCPGLRDAMPSIVAVPPPDSAIAHPLPLTGRNGGLATTTATLLPVVEPLHAHNRNDASRYRLESAVLPIADLTHRHGVTFLPISQRDIALLRPAIYLADRDRLTVLRLAGPLDPVPIAQSVDGFTHAINVGYRQR
jgi:hypothetical protein